jgi:hypothetical protein
MNSDQEMKQWREAWQVESAASTLASAEIRNKAIRQEKSLRFKFSLEMALAVTLLVGSAIYASVRHDAEMFLWMVIVWLLTISASAFSIWNWQALWRASAQSVAGYMALYRARAQATLRAVKFGWAFLIFQLFIVVPWLTYDRLQHRMPHVRYGFAMLLLALLTFVYVRMFLRQRRKALQEIQLVGKELGDAEN